MIHLGDITKISGYTAPIVDCVIGGSPCQGLSQAGLREGLADERSGLFTEQIRIIKEMRKRNANNGTTDIRPRYMVWENVPGAFSSNRGEDFRIVLEETAKVADENAVIPEPPKGKWTTSGCIMGDGWSIAWRVLDAQFWGVPQRRRRIALVADFGGQSAQEILFVRKGVSGDTEQGKQKRKDSTEDASGCIGTTDCLGTTAYTLKIRGGCEGGGKGALIQTDKSATLSTLQDQTLFQPITQQCYSKRKRAQSATDNETWVESDTANTLNAFDIGDVRTTEAVVFALDRASFNQGKNAKFDFEVSDKGINSPLVAKGPSAVAYATEEKPVICLQGNGIDRADTAGCNGKGWREDVSYTLNTMDRPAVCYSVDQGGGKSACNVTEGQAPTLTCTHGGEPAVCYEPIAAVDCRNGTEDDTNGALQSNMAHSLNGNNVVRTRYTVRRLTPLECERLQGYPDGWTDIGDWTDSNGKVRKTSDAARYKALGNSIALPPWKWVIKRLCACYERDATMASLFDGIGGLPYIWEQINGKGSCLWASEIEEFPIAVTKERINKQ